jgi:hypothetical protein
VLGNYSLSAGSPAIDYVTLLTSAITYAVAPGDDFFGNGRKGNNGSDAQVDAGAVEFQAGGGGGGGSASVAPTSLAFGNVVANNNSAVQTLTLSNNGASNLTGISVAFTPSVFSRSGGSCGTGATFTLNAGASCTIGVLFRPTGTAVYNGTATINGATFTGSPVALTGTGTTPPARPTLTVLDNFNRANSSNLGSNWGTTVIGIDDVTNGNANTATAICSGLACILGGQATWNNAFGAKQAAAFAIASNTRVNDALELDATGNVTLGVSANFVRVQLTNTTTITVATTTTSGLTYTTAGTLTGFTAVNSGQTLTALLDGTNAVAAPTVYVWRTDAANVTTFLGAVQIAPNALWQGGGKIGMQLPFNATTPARVDNFAGGTVP